MSRTEDEATSLAGIANGNEEAFERIYREHKDNLLTLAAFLLGDRHAAEDALHDVFVSLAHRAKHLELTGSLKAYLVTSCRNRCRDLLRERVRKRDKICATGVASDEIVSHVYPSTEPADDVKPVLAAMLELPDEQREVVTLRTYGGLKFQEIADLQGISINTVQSRYRYAIDSLRVRLTGEDGRL